MSKRIVITGANGFIGAEACKFFLEKGWSVTGLVRKIPQNTIEGVIYFTWELGQEPPAGIFAGTEALLHAANAFDMNGQDTIFVNEDGAKKLIHVAKEQKVRHLVFLSSFSAVPSAESVYGRHKFRIQQLFFDNGGLVLRPGLVKGEGGLYLAIKNYIRDHKRIPLVAGGTQPVQLIKVQTLLNAIFNGIEKNMSGIFSLADHEPITMKMLYENICRELNVRRTFISLPYWFVNMGISAFGALGIKTPVTKENLRGLKMMRTEDVSSGRKLII